MSSLAYAALWAFVFALPWETLVALPGISITTKATGALALGLTLLAVVVSGRVRRWRLFQIAAALFVTWTAFGVWFLALKVIPLKMFTFVQLFFVLWMIWEIAPTLQRCRGLFAAYVLGAYIPAIATIFVYLEAGESARRFSAGGDANDLAMTLALALPLAWYLGMTTQNFLVRWLYRAYVPLGLFAIALTGSRGGLLAVVVALLVIPLTLTLSPGRLAAAIVLLGLSGSLMVSYVPEKVMERLGTTGTEVQEARFGGRFKLWNAGLRAFVRRPVIGYGAAGFKPAITPELGPLALVAHNSFLSVLVEEGIIGFVLYMTMLLAVFFPVLRLPRLERRFGLVLLATLGATMMPLTWEDQKVVWFILAALYGLATLPHFRRMQAAYAPAGRGARIPRQPVGPGWERAPSLARNFGRDSTA